MYRSCLYLLFYRFIINTLHYPNDIDKSLNEAAADKIRKYRADYNDNPLTEVSFMSAVVSTSDRLQSEFVRLLFLQAHRETDRFFADSGVQVAQHDRGLFHFQRTTCSVQLKSRVGLENFSSVFPFNVNSVDYNKLRFVLKCKFKP